MKLGTDIVHIPRFEKLMENEGFIKKVFHNSECKNYTREHLAGIFAAKEAFFKAANRKMDWLDIEIKNDSSGKPIITLSNELKEVEVVDVSISHDRDYALAAVLVK